MFKRIKEIFLSNIEKKKDNEVEETVEETITELETELSKTKMSFTQVMAIKNSIQKDYNDLSDKIELWTKNAMLSIERNDDNYAKEALKKKNDFIAQRELKQEQLNTQEEYIRELKESLNSLELKIQELKNIQSMSLNKIYTAEASMDMSNLSSKLRNPEIDEALDDLKDKADYDASMAELNKRNFKSEMDELENKYKD